MNFSITKKQKTDVLQAGEENQSMLYVVVNLLQEKRVVSPYLMYGLLVSFYNSELCLSCLYLLQKVAKSNYIFSPFFLCLFLYIFHEN